jgi:hypothetical protein
MRAHLNRVEPAESSKRQQKEDGARGPLCKRVAFLGVVLTRDGWGCGFCLFAGHFRREVGECASKERELGVVLNQRSPQLADSPGARSGRTT